MCISKTETTRIFAAVLRKTGDSAATLITNAARGSPCVTASKIRRAIKRHAASGSLPEFVGLHLAKIAPELGIQVQHVAHR